MRYKIGFAIGILFFICLSHTNAAVNLPSTGKSSNVQKVLNIQRTNFTNWNQNVTYVSSVSYSAKGMKPFYNIAKWILNFIVGETLLPEGECVFLFFC